MDGSLQQVYLEVYPEVTRFFLNCLTPHLEAYVLKIHKYCLSNKTSAFPNEPPALVYDADQLRVFWDGLLGSLLTPLSPAARDTFHQLDMEDFRERLEALLNDRMCTLGLEEELATFILTCDSYAWEKNVATIMMPIVRARVQKRATAPADGPEDVERVTARELVCHEIGYQYRGPTVAYGVRCLVHTLAHAAGEHDDARWSSDSVTLKFKIGVSPEHPLGIYRVQQEGRSGSGTNSTKHCLLM